MTLQSSLPPSSAEQPVSSNPSAPVLQQAPLGSTNGASLPTATRLPKGGRRGSRLFRILMPLGIVGALVVIVAAVWAIVWFRGPSVPTDLVTDKVEYRDLQLKIVERGTLDAREKHDIKCEVKTGSRGAPKIKWVVDNGAFVKGPEGEGVVCAVGLGGFDFTRKGDLIVDIDDSYLQEQATTQKIARDKAESDKISAEQDYPVKFSAIGLAEQTLEQWTKGLFPQTLHDYEGQIQTAESNLFQEDDRTSWVARMVKKGYMTASQEEAEQALLMGSRLALQKVQEQKKVLLVYTDPVNRQTYENAIKQAKNQERSAYATMMSAQAVFLQQDSQYRDLLDQIKQCKVYAQYTGIVVYTVPEQTRTGSGANQSIIAQGEPVQYGQKMLSIPDLSHMVVNVRIHEAFINNMRQSLPVHVRVDAVPGKTLSGHVKSVDNVAAAQDWMSPDVKVYPALVEITDPVEQLKLKPGLSAVSTIYTDTQATHVLAVPLPAIVRPQEKGAKPRCFVMTPHGPEMREIELGINDEKYVEVKSGLSEGESVVLNPRALLSDKEKKGGNQSDEKIVPSGKGGPQGKGGGGYGGGGQPPSGGK